MRSIMLGVVLVAGCGVDTEEDILVGVDGKGDGVVALAPTYALELTSAMKTEDRRESDPAKRFKTLSLKARAQVKVTKTDDTIKLVVKLCDVRLPVVGGYQPELDASFVASLPALQITGAIETETTTKLVTSPAALVLGAALANPVTDTLPRSGARIRDQDGDGNPGVSIAIPGYGSIFAALRVKLALTAPLANTDAITASADVELDQAIYGDDIWFYDAATSAAETEANVSVVSATNKVRMKRDASTCAKVRALFP